MCNTWGTVGWDNPLQTGRSRVRFPMVPMEFFIVLIPGPWVDSDSNRNISWRVKAARAYGWQSYRHCLEIWEPQPPGTLRACPGLFWNCFTLFRSQWPRGLRSSFAVARLLRLWVRIPPKSWMSVCECCMLSGRSLWVELITLPEEYYRMWCVVLCDQETSWMRRPWPTTVCCAKKKKV